MFLHLSVSHSVHGGGGGCLVLGAWSRGVCAWSQGGPGRDPPEMATAAGGTHPTGMHSCYILIFTVRKRSCRKVMFLHLSVNYSVHGGVSASVHAGIHHTPLARHPPR